jgi:hypothetical protein
VNTTAASKPSRARRPISARPLQQTHLREVILDLVGQRLVGVLGFFSVRPEVERRTRGDAGPAEQQPAASATRVADGSPIEGRS